LGGRAHVFAHNGHLPSLSGARSVGLKRFNPIGDSDSEVAFCILLEQLTPLWRRTNVPSLSDRLGVIRAFAAQMRELGPANFLYTDGDALFAHGHRRTQDNRTIAPPGLWLLKRQCGCDKDALVPSGVSIDSTGSEQRIVLLASVKLTDEPWQPLDEGEVLAVRNGNVIARPNSGNRRQVSA